MGYAGWSKPPNPNPTGPPIVIGTKTFLKTHRSSCNTYYALGSTMVSYSAASHNRTLKKRMNEFTCRYFLSKRFGKP